MKKQILNIVTVLAIGSFAFVSCSENKEEATEQMHEEHNHSAMYQCPMDCENGKTYDEAGKCPVCNMDLKEMEHNH